MKKVLLIDSGSGGVNVLAECVRVCPCFDYLLFIDENNLPYGEKTESELVVIAENILNNVLSFFSADIVIFACNTLTAVAISAMREKFKDVFFIGSQPAILPALNRFKKEGICALVTRTTKKYCPILKGCQPQCKVVKNLPQIIDENLFERENIVQFLKEKLVLKNKKAIVLGCTHFEGIEKEIKLLYPEIATFSSSKGIAERLKNHSSNKEDFQVQIMTNGNNLAKFLHYYSSISQTKL